MSTSYGVLLHKIIVKIFVLGVSQSTTQGRKMVYECYGVLLRKLVATFWRLSLSATKVRSCLRMLRSPATQSNRRRYFWGLSPSATNPRSGLRMLQDTNVLRKLNEIMKFWLQKTLFFALVVQCILKLTFSCFNIFNYFTVFLEGASYWNIPCSNSL